MTCRDRSGDHAFLASTIRRAWKWHSLLRGGARNRLSREEQQGLIGELLFLERLGAEIAPKAAVEAWRGPLDEPKDFVFEGTAVEVNPDSTVANISEWAKKSACWSRVKDVEFQLPEELDRLLLDSSSKRSVAREAKATQKMDNGIEAQAEVLKTAPTTWSKALSHARSRKLLSGTDHSLLQLATRPGFLPSEKQALRLVQALRELQADGLAP